MKRLASLSIITFLISLSFCNQTYSNNSNEIDEYVILNLHWSEGEITLNGIKKVAGLIKRAGKKAIVQPFFYTITTDNGEIVKAGYFKVPRNLHFDYFDESEGELKGGQLKRDELDFVIRVPSYNNAKQINFYKKNSDLELHGVKSNTVFKKAHTSQLLGKIDL